MTRRTRKSSPSPKFLPKSSATDTPKRKNRHKIPEESVYDDYSEASLSQSPYQSGEDEVEQPLINADEASFSEPESETNSRSDQFSSPLPESIPESNNFEENAALNSAANSRNRLEPIPQNASYINIAPFPMFRGNPDECPVTHLSRFTKVCRANNAFSIEMMMRIFPVTLDNEAALWYDLNIEPYPSLTWEEIKSSFLEAYGRNEVPEQFRSELMMIDQGREESVRSYFLRLQWILKRWPDHGLSDGLLKGIFVDGLREDFQNWIIPQKPSSLNDALRFAFNWEQVQSIRPARRKDSKCGFCDGLHEERDCEIRERMRELWVRSKERQLGASSSETGDNAIAKELLRSVSAEASSVVGTEEVEEGNEEGGLQGGKKKTQCQCWKHQCWKKKLERTNSLVIGNSNAD